MFTSVGSRQVNSYKNVAVETSVSQADPHSLVSLLYDALLQSLSAAKSAILASDVATKGRSISRAVRILEEGLKAGLNMELGGELALNLRDLYDYCVLRVTEANLHDDPAIIDEVVGAIRPVAEGWSQIRDQVVPQRRAA